MASKLPVIKNCKCGEEPSLIELGTYFKVSYKGLYVSRRKPETFVLECSKCGEKPMFRSSNKKTAIETWNRRSSC